MTDRAPDLVTPILGWRQWRLVQNRGRLELAAMFRSGVWPAGEPMRAVCDQQQQFGTGWVRATLLDQSGVELWVQELRVDTGGSVTFTWPAPFLDGSVLRAVFRADPPACEHRAPVAGCQCGVYALPTLGDVKLPPGPDVVTGSVLLWGRVVRHTHGWRAEFAYPHELWVNPLVDDRVVARMLADRYRVPVHVGHPEDAPLRREAEVLRREAEQAAKRALRLMRGWR